MDNRGNESIGSVAELWRYPVKSMMGERLSAAELSRSGVRGDREFAIRDLSTGKIASAKNPKKWPNLFDFHASLITPSGENHGTPQVRITLPDGKLMTSQQPDSGKVLSEALKRAVRLEAIENDLGDADDDQSRTEEYWPDLDGLDFKNTTTEFALPRGTFFDSAYLHLLTTATLDRLQELYPEGRFDVQRFRPNIVIRLSSGERDFVESAWIGRLLHIGEQVRVRIERPCGRCVMTTLPQGDLPQDLGILRAAAQANHAHVGVYGSVLSGGSIYPRDVVHLE